MLIRQMICDIDCRYCYHYIIFWDILQCDYQRCELACINSNSMHCLEKKSCQNTKERSSARVTIFCWRETLAPRNIPSVLPKQPLFCRLQIWRSTRTRQLRPLHRGQRVGHCDHRGLPLGLLVHVLQPVLLQAVQAEKVSVVLPLPRPNKRVGVARWLS